MGLPKQRWRSIRAQRRTNACTVSGQSFQRQNNIRGDAYAIDVDACRRLIASNSDSDPTAIRQVDHSLDQPLAKSALARDDAALAVFERACKHLQSVRAGACASDANWAPGKWMTNATAQWPPPQQQQQQQQLHTSDALAVPRLTSTTSGVRVSTVPPSAE